LKHSNDSLPLQGWDVEKALLFVESSKRSLEVLRQKARGVDAGLDLFAISRPRHVELDYTERVRTTNPHQTPHS
jgi:hypothetical protein